MFIWDDANLLHIARHDVTPQEAEDVLLNDPVHLDAQIVDGEIRLPYVGVTSSGRVLGVVLVEVEQDVRVVTAFVADGPARRMYAKRKGN